MHIPVGSHTTRATLLSHQPLGSRVWHLACSLAVTYSLCTSRVKHIVGAKASTQRAGQAQPEVRQNWTSRAACGMPVSLQSS